MWPHPISLLLDSLFAVCNFLFIVFLVTIFTFGDDLVEYCQVKLRLSTNVERQLQRTAVSSDLHRPPLVNEHQQALQQRQWPQDQRAPSPGSTASSSTGSPSPEPEYHTIAEQPVDNSQHRPLHPVNDNRRRVSLESGRLLEEEEIQVMEPSREGQREEQSWYSLPEAFSCSPIHSPLSGAHSVRSSSPDDDVSSQSLEELYLKGRGKPPSPIPITEDPLWYTQNQSTMSVNKFQGAATASDQVMSDGLYAEVQDSNRHILSSTPVTGIPHIGGHCSTAALGLTDRNGSLPHSPVVVSRYCTQTIIIMP